MPSRFPRFTRLILSTAALAAACGQYSSSGGAGLISVIAQPHTAIVAPGKKVSFTAAVSGASGGQSAGVIWSVQEPQGGSVDLAGVYTAPMTSGTFHVVATSFASPSSNDVATVTVEGAPTLAVAVTPKNASTLAGGTIPFSATVTGAGAGQPSGVVWSVQESGGGSIDASGVYVAPATTGTFHVIATALADSTVKDVATVQVTATPVVTVSISPKTAATTTGNTLTFSAMVTGTTAGQSTAVTWSVQEASGGTVDSAGNYTAPATAGTYHVVATSVADTTKNDTATVTITAIAVAVSPKTKALTTGGTQPFTATVTGTVAGQSTAVTWAVQEANGGTVNTAGLYTAPGAAGTFHVVATSAADTTRKDTATVTVTAIAVAVSPKTKSLTTGGTQQFTATVTGTVTGQSTAVTWSVQEAGGGTVSTAGLYTAPASAGTYHVVATSVADTSKSDTATVTVTPPAVAVTISPKTTSTSLSGTRQFTATVTGSANTNVTWAVQEGTSGGTVDSTGKYTAPATAGTYHVVVTAAADTTKTDVATVSVLTSTGSAAPMALISRTVPATSSAGTASWGQDASYGGIDWQMHMADVGNTGWLAYDLSGVASAQRQKVLVALYMTKGDPYYQLNFRAASYTAEYTPNAYVLEGATSSSGPWTTLVNVATNNNPFKSHYIGSFGSYTFLRFRSTSGPNGCRVKMDVYDASGGITDGIVFYGDSITANLFQSGYNGFPPEWFSKQVAAAHPGFFPFVTGGGYPFMTAGDGVDLVVTDSGTNFSTGLTSPLSIVFADAKYAALIWGANDAPAQNLVDAFRSNYTQIINALRSNGQTVVVASPTWATDTGRQAGLVQIRAAIGFQLPAWTAKSYASGDYVWNGTRAYKCTTAGTSVTGPTGTGTGIADGGTARWAYVPSLREDYAADSGVIAGPDLYTVFQNHPEWLGDGLHPNDTGEGIWRNAWVSWANASIYGP